MNLFFNKKENKQLELLVNEHFPYIKLINSVQEEISGYSKGFYDLHQKGQDKNGNEISFPTYRSSEIYFWKPILRWLYEDVNKNKITNCLDIGCGYGTLSLYIKKLVNCNIFMVDFIDVYVSQDLIKNYGFIFKLLNVELEKIPFKSNKFDIILLTEVIEHFNFYPIPTMKKIADLLNQNGKMYFSTPDSDEWGKLDNYNSYKNMPLPSAKYKVFDAHIYQYNYSELLEIFQEVGLKIERYDYSPGYLNQARHLCFSLNKA